MVNRNYVAAMSLAALLNAACGSVEPSPTAPSPTTTTTTPAPAPSPSPAPAPAPAPSPAPSPSPSPPPGDMRAYLLNCILNPQYFDGRQSYQVDSSKLPSGVSMKAITEPWYVRNGGSEPELRRETTFELTAANDAGKSNIASLLAGQTGVTSSGNTYTVKGTHERFYWKNGKGIELYPGMTFVNDKHTQNPIVTKGMAYATFVIGGKTISTRDGRPSIIETIPGMPDCRGSIHSSLAPEGGLMAYLRTLPQYRTRG